ncbi:MAG: hypothetical protein SGARI_003230, partial [Bacillariaceae sp.]
MLYFRHIPTDEQKIRKIFNERMLKARVNQEDNRKLKAYRQVLYGKYSTSVPSIMWTPHNDFPRPDSTARYHGAASNIVPRVKDLEKCPFVPGQRLHGHMIPRPEIPYQRNQRESREVMKRYKKLMKARRRKKKRDDDQPTDLNGIDVGSMGSEEGFEVMELYDEELGFVRDVLAPPKEDSTRELGVEILQNSDQDMFFQEAFKSIHDFSKLDDMSHFDEDSDDDDSAASANDSSNGTGSKDDPISVVEDPRQQFAKTKASRPDSSLNLSKDGIEITEVSEQEARFVRRSWQDRSSMSLNSSLPSVRFSMGDIQFEEEDVDDGMLLERIQEMDEDDCKAYFTEELFGEASSSGNNGIEVTDLFQSEFDFIEKTLSKDSADVVSTSAASRAESSLDSGARYIENMISEDSIDANETDLTEPFSNVNTSAVLHVDVDDVDPEATPRQDNRDTTALSPRHDQGWASAISQHFSFGGGSGSALSRRPSPAVTPSRPGGKNDDGA